MAAPLDFLKLFQTPQPAGFQPDTDVDFAGLLAQNPSLGNAPQPMPDALEMPEPIFDLPTGPMPPPMLPPPTHEGGVKGLLRDLLPALASLGATAVGGPGAGIGMSQGFVHAQQMADQQRMQQEKLAAAEMQRQAAINEKRLGEARQFIGEARKAILGASTPQEFDSLVKLYDQQAPSYGVRPMFRQTFSFDDAKRQAAARVAAQNRLKAIRTAHPNDFDKIAATGSVKNDDGSVSSIAQLMEQAGELVTGPNGQPMFGAPEQTPIYRVDAKKGNPELVGMVPKGAQVLQQAQPPRVNVSMGGASADATDTRTLAEDLAAGRLMPSDLMKRGNYNQIVATASRMGRQNGKPLNITKMRLDEAAAKRFVASLNSERRLTYNSLAESVVNTIDEVRDLSNQLKQGGMQKWNAAKREGIMQMYGNSQYSAAAARYMTAVNTLKEEFAQLASGGYAPTEDAWKLANSQINGNYGVKDLDASLVEVQRLINYRLGAFLDQAPTYLGGQSSIPIGDDQFRSGRDLTPHNPPPQAGPAKRIRYDINGNPIK